MSLVGPRPPLPYELEQYEPWHRRRVLEAKPGLTGLWQVVGRSRTTFDEMVRLDLRYARTRSLWTDIKILLATPRAVISGRAPVDGNQGRHWGREHVTAQPNGAVRARVPREAADGPHLGTASGLDGDFWESVGRFLDRAASLEDLRSHGIEPLALASRLRVGRLVPSTFIAEVRASALPSLAAPLLLQRVRELCDGPIVL